MTGGTGFGLTVDRVGSFACKGTVRSNIAIPPQEAGQADYGLPAIAVDMQIYSAHKQQLSADQPKRNEVEGCFGSGKRKYSLDLIMARLPKGAETSISMAFVVMCAEKIRRLLRLFFVIIFAWFYAVKRPGCLWMSLRALWRDETADFLLPI
jgi:hypothetical protein